MAFEVRKGKPYIWVTWITGLVSGEKSCRWAAWFRAHHQYEKRPDENENQLSAWKADHAAMVRSIVDDRLKQGYTDVNVEDQNSFTYRGKLAVVGGKADVTYRAADGTGLRFEDAKTGKERDSDMAQVVTYMMLAPVAWEDLTPRSQISGAVIYRNRQREVGPMDVERLKPKVIEVISAAALDISPPKTPSAAECAYCDILDCDERVVGRRDGAEVPEDEAFF